jgi:lysozyme family protein
MSDIDRFILCLPWIMQSEGGYVENPADPGGATNMGITLGTLAAWRGHPCTRDDVRALTRDEAAAIYRARYWTDGLAPGVDLSVFDASVMSGKSQGVKFLQAAAGVDADGACGPHTLAACAALLPLDLIDRIADERAAFYRNIVGMRPASGVFLDGWLSRVERTAGHARTLA